jgi:hypothetical protein
MSAMRSSGQAFVEAAIRFGVFLSIFAAVALAEWQFPKRDRTQPRATRWRINVGMLVFDVLAQFHAIERAYPNVWRRRR